MIRKLLVAAVFLFVSFPAFAASFLATIDDDHVMANEAVTLQLTLTGAEAKTSPDTAALTQAFSIVGQGQTSETRIINGVMSSSIGWQLTLMPKSSGHVTIPAVTINTDKGQLSTQPIILEIGGANSSSKIQANAPEPSKDRGVLITASANNLEPYQNQPIIYTVRILTHATLQDISLSDVHADNAIVQPQGEPQIKDAEDNGVPGKVIEFRYVVTPIQAKPVTIEPVTLQGSIESAAPTHRIAQISNGFTDPFALLQAMNSHFGGFAQMRPFQITSNAVSLQVKPPAAIMEPWLPLENLQITETFNLPKTIKVGEPLTRTFMLTATGEGGSQLPSLEAQQNAVDFKVYADKPKLDQTIDKTTGAIIGHREESYSIIPMKAGTLHLPEIRVAWWDTRNNHIAYAELPAHTLDVMPETPANSPPVVIQSQTPASAQLDPARLQPASVHHLIPWFVYASGALALGCLGSLGLIIALRRTLSHKVQNDLKIAQSNVTKSGSGSAINWSYIQTAAALNDRLLTYAHERWNTPRHAALETVFNQLLPASLAEQQKTDIDAFVRDLMAAIYAAKSIDLDAMKKRARKIIDMLEHPPKTRTDKAKKLPDLNPR